MLPLSGMKTVQGKTRRKGGGEGRGASVNFFFVWKNELCSNGMIRLGGAKLELNKLCI